MVDQHDGAVGRLGNSAPLLCDHVHCGVVVLVAQAVRADEGVNGQDIDLARKQFGNDTICHGRVYLRPLATHPRKPQCGAFHRSEEHTSELQSLMRISYAVFCLKKKKNKQKDIASTQIYTT